MAKTYEYNFVRGATTGVSSTLTTDYLKTSEFTEKNSSGVVTATRYGLYMGSFFTVCTCNPYLTFNTADKGGSFNYTITMKLEISGTKYGSSLTSTPTSYSLTKQASSSCVGNIGTSGNGKYFSDLFGALNSSTQGELSSIKLASLSLVRYTFTIKDNTNTSVSDKTLTVNVITSSTDLNVRNKEVTTLKCITLSNSKVGKNRITIPNAARNVTIKSYLVSSNDTQTLVAWNTLKLVPIGLGEFITTELTSDGTTYSTGTRYPTPRILNGEAQGVYSLESYPASVRDSIVSDLTVTATSNASSFTTATGNTNGCLHSLIYSIEASRNATKYWNNTGCTEELELLKISATSGTRFQEDGSLFNTASLSEKNIYGKSSELRNIGYVVLAEADENYYIERTTPFVNGVEGDLTVIPSSIMTFAANPCPSLLTLNIKSGTGNVTLPTNINQVTGTTSSGIEYCTKWQTASSKGIVYSFEITNTAYTTDAGLSETLFSVNSVTFSNSLMPAPISIAYNQYYTVGDSSKFIRENKRTVINGVDTIETYIYIPIHETALVNGEYKVATYEDFLRKFSSHYSIDKNSSPYGLYYGLKSSTGSTSLATLTLNRTVSTKSITTSDYNSTEDNNTIQTELISNVNSYESYKSIYPVTYDRFKQVTVNDLLTDDKVQPTVTIEYVGYSTVKTTIIGGGTCATFLNISSSDGGETITQTVSTGVTYTQLDVAPGYHYSVSCTARNAFYAVTSPTIEVYDPLLFYATLRNADITDLVSGTQPTGEYNNFSPNAYNLRIGVTGSTTSRKTGLAYADTAVTKNLSSIKGGNYTIVLNSSEITNVGNTYNNHLVCEDFRKGYGGSTGSYTTTRNNQYPVGNICKARFPSTYQSTNFSSSYFTPKAMYIAPSKTTSGNISCWYGLSNGEIVKVNTSTDAWYATNSTPLAPTSVAVCQLQVNGSNTSLTINASNVRVYNGVIDSNEIIFGPKDNEIWYKLSNGASNPVICANGNLDSTTGKITGGINPVDTYFSQKLGVYVAIFDEKISKLCKGAFAADNYHAFSEVHLPKTVTECEQLAFDYLGSPKSYAWVYTYSSKTHNCIPTEELNSVSQTISVYCNLDGKMFSVKSSNCCFVQGTKVLVGLSGETKNIEEIGSGDTVVSYNTETGEKYLAIVKRLILNEKSRYLLTVKTKSGKEVVMTSYHPLLTTDGWHSYTNYNCYQKLSIYDTLITDDGEDEIETIEESILPYPITTYNLDVVDFGEDPDVDVNDSFFANGIVAHNGC